MPSITTRSYGAVIPESSVHGIFMTSIKNPAYLNLSVPFNEFLLHLAQLTTHMFELRNLNIIICRYLNLHIIIASSNTKLISGMFFIQVQSIFIQAHVMLKQPPMAPVMTKSLWQPTVTSIHHNDVTMGTMASQITSLTIVYSAVYSGTDQRKHQSSASLAFVWGIHRGPVNSPHKGPVTRKMFPFDDVIMTCAQRACDFSNDIIMSEMCFYLIIDINANKGKSIATASLSPTCRNLSIDLITRFE